MTLIPADDPVAVAATDAVQRGDLTELRRLLDENPGLAGVRIGTEDPNGMSRTLLHAVTDWPGHYPNVTASIELLIEHGADVDAASSGRMRRLRCIGRLAAMTSRFSTPSSTRARTSRPPAPSSGAAARSPTRGFKQWSVAFRLIERGARTTLMDAATMGLDDRVREHLATDPHPHVASTPPSWAFATLAAQLLSVGR